MPAGGRHAQQGNALGFEGSQQQAPGGVIGDGGCEANRDPGPRQANRDVCSLAPPARW